MNITFINVGYGESVLIETEEVAILIDGGSAEAAEFSSGNGRIRAYDYLYKRGIRRLDAVFVTHVHEDHLCGLMPILHEMDVARLWLPFPLCPHHAKEVKLGGELPVNLRKSLVAINDFIKLSAFFPKERVNRIDESSLPLQFPGFKITPLNPASVAALEVFEKICTFADSKNPTYKRELLTCIDAAMNNVSLVLRVDIGKRRVLLAGDLNAAGFERLLVRCADDLRADIFKIGHHGQLDSVSAQLIDAVRPNIVVCSASNDCRYGSSNAKVFSLIDNILGSENIRLLHTDPFSETAAPRHAVSIIVTPDANSSKDWATISYH